MSQATFGGASDENGGQEAQEQPADLTPPREMGETGLAVVNVDKHPKDWDIGEKGAAYAVPGECVFCNCGTYGHSYGIGRVYNNLTRRSKVDRRDIRSTHFIGQAVRCHVESKGPHKQFVIEEKDSGMHELVANTLVENKVVPKSRIRFSRDRSDFGPL